MRDGRLRDKATFLIKVAYLGGVYTLGTYVVHRFVIHEPWGPACWVLAGLFFGLLLAWFSAEKLVNRIVRWVEGGRGERVVWSDGGRRGSMMRRPTKTPRSEPASSR